MKILFDTNVLLDVLLAREPWYQNALTLWQANDTGLIHGHISATTVTDIFYISRRYTNAKGALEAVITCLDAFSIIAIGQDELKQATEMAGSDFEDNLQIVAAKSVHLDAIVTRNVADFQNTQITIFTPEQALNSLKN
ncbi:MAG: PIN domain-containing protein [Anaerolineaceae bacterium]|nr:PIN domain-containing protein [Anaerolineaceae bacterium]